MLFLMPMNLYFQAGHPMSKLCANQAAKTLKENGMKLKKGRSFRHVVIYPDGDSGPYECGTRIIPLILTMGGSPFCSHQGFLAVMSLP